ncbi:MAG TPA: hypothetical protein VNH82_11195 [Candidatus Dormibacteraeota bacterium]|nr:hypothetical protein [Candidatus Dormibacteraeota bacterium]
MRDRKTLWLVPTLIVVLSVIGLNTAAAASAEQSIGSTAVVKGATSETVTLPNSILRITLGQPGVASPNGYVEQYAKVDDIGTGIFSGFEATMSGDWEYNGTYAYTVGSVSHHVTNGGATYCLWSSTNIYGNGAKNPANMSWDGAGYCDTPTPANFYLYLYFWGSGTAKAAVSGP